MSRRSAVPHEDDSFLRDKRIEEDDQGRRQHACCVEVRVDRSRDGGGWAGECLDELEEGVLYGRMRFSIIMQTTGP